MKKEERVLMYPAIYKHFKGKDYATMGISHPVKFETIKKETVDPIRLVFMHAEDSETKKAIAILSVGGEWVHLEEEYNKGLVLYKSLYDNHGVYCRDVEMFMSEIDVKREDNVTKQKHRFELVEY